MTPQKIKLTVTSEDLLTIPQAAEELGIHRATFYRWVDGRKVHPFHIGDQLFVTADQVRALKEERAQLSTSSMKGAAYEYNKT